MCGLARLHVAVAVSGQLFVADRDVPGPASGEHNSPLFDSQARPDPFGWVVFPDVGETFFADFAGLADGFGFPDPVLVEEEVVSTDAGRSFFPFVHSGKLTAASCGLVDLPVDSENFL